MPKIKYRTKEFKENALTLTVAEAAALLGVSEWTGWRMVKLGKLPVIRLGRLVKVPKIQLEAMLAGKLEV